MSKSLDLEKTIAQLADQIELCKLDDPYLVGIRSGGVWIAERIHQLLDIKEPLGVLDISFYRDDFSRVGLNPQVKPSELPGTVEGRNIILIDDVLYSGRTIRAAMNEIFSYGRPDMVKLGVLIERSGRELPIQPDFFGSSMKLSQHQQAKLSNKDGKLNLKITSSRSNT